MTPAEFTAWRERLHLSRTSAAQELGISRNQPQKYEEGKTPIPRHIALACAAIAAGVPPIGRGEVHSPA